MIEPHVQVILRTGRRLFMTLEEGEKLRRIFSIHKIQVPRWYRFTDIFGCDMTFDVRDIVQVAEFKESSYIRYLEFTDRMHDLWHEYGPHHGDDLEDWQKG